MTVDSLAWRHFPGLVIAGGHADHIVTPAGITLRDFTSGFCPSGLTNTGYQSSAAGANGATHGRPLPPVPPAPADLLAALRPYLPAACDGLALFGDAAQATIALVTCARRATGRPGIVFIRDPRQPRMPPELLADPEIVVTPFPRPAAADPPGVTVAGALAALDAAMAAWPHALVVVEPILGGGAAVVAPRGYLVALRERTSAAGAWLAVDERGAGYGRSGYFFAHHDAGIDPDVVLLGGAMAGGASLAALVGPAAHMPEGEDETVAAVALETAVATVPHAAALIANAAARGEQLRHALRAMQSRYPFFAAVNGRGLLQSVSIGVPGRGPDPYLTALIQAQCLAEGLLLAAGDHDDSALVWQPPLAVDAAAIDTAIETLEDAFEEVFDD